MLTAAATAASAIREVHAIVLETDGSFSVMISIADDVAYSTLRGVHGADAAVAQ